MRNALIGLAVGLLFAAAAASASAAAFHNADGLTIQSVSQIDQRLYALTVATSALPQPVDVRILLPDGYDANPTRRYPVLYLLDGTSGLASDWTTLGGAEQTTAGLGLIVVMPNIDLGGDGGGWCTNWPNGAENWETFHIAQLLPWIDENLRTIPSRAQRAIAGLSQGGFCSLSYAARHPDLFSVALGYSGAPDIYWDKQAFVGANLIIGGTELGLTHVPPGTFFGNPLTDGINWAAHDPATLAQNLASTRMYMYWGNGFPGPYDTGAPNPEANLIEGAVDYDNQYFQQRLDSLGIPAYFDAYGNGEHAWPYWARDLQWSIGKVMDDFANPVAAPSRITYTSADDIYSAYGWTVSTHRTAREFSTLQDADAAGFTLAGSGSATVQTPAAYTPGAGYAVSLSGPNASGRQILTAGDDGRLTVQVPLGPANQFQEYTPEATAAGTSVYSTTVEIAPAGS